MMCDIGSPTSEDTMCVYFLDGLSNDYEFEQVDIGFNDRISRDENLGTLRMEFDKMNAESTKSPPPSIS